MKWSPKKHRTHWHHFLCSDPDTGVLDSDPSDPGLFSVRHWWIKLYWDRFSSHYFHYPISVSFPHCPILTVILIEAIRLVYFSYFHSILPYGVIFWGNSVHSKYIFKIKKRTLRVITDSGMRDSCPELFKKFQILPLSSQYSFSWIMFIVKNGELFKLNSDIHHIETRYNNDFHLPSTQLNLFQKGGFYSGIKMYNRLSLSIKDLSHDIKWFKRAVKGFIHSNSFPSLEEYFNFNW
jgi:hypothetical protein